MMRRFGGFLMHNTRRRRRSGKSPLLSDYGLALSLCLRRRWRDIPSSLIMRPGSSHGGRRFAENAAKLLVKKKTRTKTSNNWLRKCASWKLINSSNCYVTISLLNLSCMLNWPSRPKVYELTTVKLWDSLSEADVIGFLGSALHHLASPRMRLGVAGRLVADLVLCQKSPRILKETSECNLCWSNERSRKRRRSVIEGNPNFAHNQY